MLLPKRAAAAKMLSSDSNVLMELFKTSSSKHRNKREGETRWLVEVSEAGVWMTETGEAGMVHRISSRLDCSTTYVAHELLADVADVGAQGGGEHEDLLLVGRHLEDLLDVGTHVCGIEEGASNTTG